MLGTLAATLLIAAITGATALAFSKPVVFQRIALGLMIGVAVIFVAIAAWQASEMSAVNALAAVLSDPDEFAAARKAIEQRSFHFFYLFAPIAGLLYIQALLLILRMLEQQNREKRD